MQVDVPLPGGVFERPQELRAGHRVADEHVVEGLEFEEVGEGDRPRGQRPADAAVVHEGDIGPARVPLRVGHDAAEREVPVSRGGKRLGELHDDAFDEGRDLGAVGGDEPLDVRVRRDLVRPRLPNAEAVRAHGPFGATVDASESVRRRVRVRLDDGDAPNLRLDARVRMPRDRVVEAFRRHGQRVQGRAPARGVRRGPRRADGAEGAFVHDRDHEVRAGRPHLRDIAVERIRDRAEVEIRDERGTGDDGRGRRRRADEADPDAVPLDDRPRADPIGVPVGALEVDVRAEHGEVRIGHTLHEDVDAPVELVVPDRGGVVADPVHRFDRRAPVREVRDGRALHDVAAGDDEQGTLGRCGALPGHVAREGCGPADGASVRPALGRRQQPSVRVVRGEDQRAGRRVRGGARREGGDAGTEKGGERGSDAGGGTARHQTVCSACARSRSTSGAA